MTGYAKLSSAIVLSTVWREPHHVRIVWITMLALADAEGYVGASVPGLADAARVTLAECEEALATFSRPDPYSRTPDHEGRRVVAEPGGWRLLNYALYRAGQDASERRRQNREAQRRRRARTSAMSAARQHVSTPSAQAEAEAEAEAEADGSGRARPREDTPPDAPRWKQLLAVYERVVLEGRRMVADARHRTALIAVDDTLDAWDRADPIGFFERVLKAYDTEKRAAGKPTDLRFLCEDFGARAAAIVREAGDPRLRGEAYQPLEPLR
jgi:hypothetical protein